jgi:hypothetical protein
MVKKTITNQGRQPDDTSPRQRKGKLRQALTCRETLLLLLSCLRIVVTILRLFDR